jgi:hypothetical protein
MAENFIAELPESGHVARISELKQAASEIRMQSNSP